LEPLVAGLRTSGSSARDPKKLRQSQTKGGYIFTAARLLDAFPSEKIDQQFPGL
jgi:hypothetical protein